jgi:hypothetical protein
MDTEDILTVTLTIILLVPLRLPLTVRHRPMVPRRSLDHLPFLLVPRTAEVDPTRSARSTDTPLRPVLLSSRLLTSTDMVDHRATDLLAWAVRRLALVTSPVRVP